MRGWVRFYHRKVYLGIGFDLPQHLNQFPVHDRIDSRSRIHYCGKCGTIWAQIIFEHADGWLATNHLCVICGGDESFFHHPMLLDNIEQLPPDLKLYELMEVPTDVRYPGLWAVS